MAKDWAPTKICGTYVGLLICDLHITPKLLNLHIYAASRIEITYFLQKMATPTESLFKMSLGLKVV